MKNEFKPIKFPQDESAHNHITEWWYFNGHLKDKKGNCYTFMNCLFKVDVKKVNIPFLNRLPLKTLYFSHSILSDIKNKKNYSSIDNIDVISKDSFLRPLLFINYTNPVTMGINIGGYINCVIEKTKKFDYRIKNKNIDLNLTSIKRPLLEGGKGYVNLGSKFTYYYSLTNLKTKGIINIEDKLIEVEGKSWMDHQWGDVGYCKDAWTWFSVQLDNQTEMVCFEYNDGKTKTYLASVSYPDSKQEHFKEVKIAPLGKKWISPKTKAVYPLSWRIQIPVKNIDLKVSPLIKQQEMVFGGSINYLEGPLKVTGLFNNKKAKGFGFMELVGRPSKYTHTKYLRDELMETSNKVFLVCKEKSLNIIDNIR